MVEDDEFAKRLLRAEKQIIGEVNSKIRGNRHLTHYKEDMIQHVYLYLWKRRKHYFVIPKKMTERSHMAKIIRNAIYNFCYVVQPFRTIRVPHRVATSNKELPEVFPFIDECDLVERVTCKDTEGVIKEVAETLLELIQEEYRPLLMDLVSADNLEMVRQKHGPDKNPHWARKRKKQLIDRIKKRVNFNYYTGERSG